jgi:hypothetical protein
MVSPRNIPVWQKIRQSIPQFNRGTAGGTVNLHVFQVRLKQRKVSSHPSSLQGSNGGNTDAGKVRKFPHFQNPRCINGYYVLLPYSISKERDKIYRGFNFCTATAILHCTFYPALLASAREIRDIVKSGLTS